MNAVIPETDPDLEPGEEAKVIADKKRGGTWSTTATAGSDLNTWLVKAKNDPALYDARIVRK